MPLVAVAACPHPPVLLPEIAGAAAAELDDLRTACTEAIGRWRAAAPDCLIIVGTGGHTARVGLPARGSFAPYGLPVDIVLSSPPSATPPSAGRPISSPGMTGPGEDGRAEAAAGARAGTGGGTGEVGVVGGVAAQALPLSLTVGAWLLARQPVDLPVIAWTVAPHESPGDCAALGRDLVAGDRLRVAMLVLGDGSARRSERAPGFDDPRAEGFDANVTRAFAAADAPALLALDPGLADELLVSGRAPWQVLAGAAGDVRWRGAVHYDAAPYGVAYLVASWALACG